MTKVSQMQTKNVNNEKNDDNDDDDDSTLPFELPKGFAKYPIAP